MDNFNNGHFGANFGGQPAQQQTPDAWSTAQPVQPTQGDWLSQSSTNGGAPPTHESANPQTLVAWGTPPINPNVPQAPAGWVAPQPHQGNEEPPKKRMGLGGILLLAGAGLVLLAVLGGVLVARFNNSPTETPGSAVSPPVTSTSPSTQPSAVLPSAQPSAALPSASVSQPTPPTSIDAGWVAIGNTDGFDYKDTAEAIFMVQGTRLYADKRGGGIQVRHVAYGTVAGYGSGTTYEVEIPRTAAGIALVVPGYSFTVRFDVYMTADGSQIFLENFRP